MWGSAFNVCRSKYVDVSENEFICNANFDTFLKNWGPSPTSTTSEKVNSYDFKWTFYICLLIIRSENKAWIVLTLFFSPSKFLNMMASVLPLLPVVSHSLARTFYGQENILKCGNWSTEVWKLEEKLPIGNQCLIYFWLCVFRLCSQRVTLTLQS